MISQDIKRESKKKERMMFIITGNNTCSDLNQHHPFLRFLCPKRKPLGVDSGKRTEGHHKEPN